MEKETGKIPASLVALRWRHSDRSNQLVVRSKQPPDARASLRTSTDGRGFYNVTIAIATALFMALHNTGGFWLFCGMGSLGPKACIFTAGGTLTAIPHKNHPQIVQHPDRTPAEPRLRRRGASNSTRNHARNASHPQQRPIRRRSQTLWDGTICRYQSQLHWELSCYAARF